MSENRYASILNAVIETAKERGMMSPGSDYALACYQLIEVAKSEAEVWGVPLEAVGLADFDSDSLLRTLKRAA